VYISGSVNAIPPGMGKRFRDSNKFLPLGAAFYGYAGAVIPYGGAFTQVYSALQRFPFRSKINVSAITTLGRVNGAM
jgi:hypothetical protein